MIRKRVGHYIEQKNNSGPRTEPRETPDVTGAAWAGCEGDRSV